MKRYRGYLGVCGTLFIFTCSVQAEFLSNDTPTPVKEGEQQAIEDDQGQTEEDEQGQASEAIQPPLVGEAAPSISTGELPEAGEGPLSLSSGEQVASAESDNAASWLVEDQEFFPEDAPIGQFFGNSMAVSDNTLVVGADGGADLAGVVYIYSRNESGLWVQETRLTPENPGRDEYLYFGRAVSIGA